jgi:hypothetical protein
MRRPPIEAQKRRQLERRLDLFERSQAVVKALAAAREARERRREESEQIKKVQRMVRAENIDVEAISRELGMKESDVRFYLRKFGFL